MQIDDSSFKGEAPRMAPRLLPPGMSQYSGNARLLSGNLEPWRGFDEATTQQIKSDPPTIYYLDDQLWLSWNYTESVISLGTVEKVWETNVNGNPYWDYSDGDYLGTNFPHQLVGHISYSDGTTVHTAGYATFNGGGWTAYAVVPGPPLPTLWPSTGHGHEANDGLDHPVGAAAGASMASTAWTTIQKEVWPVRMNDAGSYSLTSSAGQYAYAYGNYLALVQSDGTQVFFNPGALSGNASNPSGGWLIHWNPATNAVGNDLCPEINCPANSYLGTAIPCADRAHVLVLWGASAFYPYQYWSLLNVSNGTATQVSSGTWTAGLETLAGGVVGAYSGTIGTGLNGNVAMLESDLQTLWLATGYIASAGFTFLNVVTLNAGTTPTLDYTQTTPLFTNSPLVNSVQQTTSLWADLGQMFIMRGNEIAAYTRGVVVPGISAANVEVDIAKAAIGGDLSFRTYFCGCDCPRFTDLGLASGLTDGSGNPITGSSTIAPGALPNGGPFPVYSRKLGVPNPTLAPSAKVVPAAANALATTITETFDGAVQWNTVSTPGFGLAQIITTGGDPGACLNTRAIGGNLPYGYKSFALNQADAITVTVNFSYQRNANDYEQDTTLVFLCSLDTTVTGSLVNILTTSSGISWSFQAINSGAYGSIIASGSIGSGSIPTWATDAVAAWTGPFRANTWYTATITVTPGTDPSESEITLVIKSGATTVLSISSGASNMPNSGPGFGFGCTVPGGFSSPYWAEVNYDNVVLNGTGPAPSTSSLEATTYLYTLVNDLGEESGPSPALLNADGSDTITRNIGQGVTVTLPGTLALSGADVSYFSVGGYTPTTQIAPNTSVPSPSMNLYRAVTGSNGSEFLLVAANIAFSGGASTTYTDTVADTALSEEMQSTLWAPPPTGMLGILPLPNQIYAGFVGNELCLSAQGVPHAWPVEYQQPFDFPIVGIQAIDSTVVVLTENFPYLCSGNTPDSYSQTKASYPYACASKRSIQYLQNVGVVFASFEGIVAIAGAGYERVLTRDLFTKKEWEALNPASMISAVNDNRYLCWYDATSIGGSKGGFYLDLQPQSPYPGIPSIVSGKCSLAFHAYARYSDPLSDILYCVLDSDPSP